MNKHTVRHLSCTLAAVMLMACACAEESNPRSTIEQTSDETTVELPQETAALKPDLPDTLDFEGEDFTVIYPGAAISMQYSFGDALSGDVMNDTLYKRDMEIEEFLHVNIIPFKVDTLDVHPYVQKSVFAGDKDYNMALTHSMNGITPMLINNLLMDWKDIPYVDFNKPWWNLSQIEELELKGKQFYASGSLLVPNPVALFYNKDLAKKHKLDDPYTTVRDGKWTIDYMISMAKEVSEDVDGNGIYDENDTFGYAGEINWKSASYMFSAGQKITEHDADGNVIFIMNCERMQTIVEKINQLYYGGNFSYGIKKNHNPLSKMFQNGQALLYIESMVNAEQYRSTNVDFGILPLPKLDENQEEYISLSWTGFMGIPKGTDPEIVGAVSELLNYKSLTMVNDVYYDILLTSKVARDDASAEMLDIIFGNYVCDMGMSYFFSPDLLFTLQNLLNKKSTNFASYYAAAIPSAEKAVQKLMNAVQ